MVMVMMMMMMMMMMTMIMMVNYDDAADDENEYNYTGWPSKNGTVDTVDFQDFALMKFFFSTLLDRASFPHYNNTKIVKIWLRTFYFISNFLWTVIFGICPISRVSRHD